MLDIKNIVGTFLVGAAGWWLAHYVGAPILALQKIRNEIHEEIFFTQNIGWVRANGKISEAEKDRYDRAVVDLRRLAARLSALRNTWPSFLNFYLRFRRFDLDKSIGGLTGLSNGLADPADHSQFVTQIEDALFLPRSYSDETLKNIRAVQKRRLEES